MKTFLELSILLQEGEITAVPVDVIQQVIRCYQHQLGSNCPQVAALGNAGGFSGAQLWQINSGGEKYCLRRWPDGVDITRLVRTHSILRAVFESGCDFIPVPVPHSNLSDPCRTLLQFDGSTWQLEPWMAGSADYCLKPTPERLIAAVGALSRFHAAVDLMYPIIEGSCPSLAERIALLEKLIGSEFDLIETACQIHAKGEFKNICTITSANFLVQAPQILKELTEVRSLPVRISPCIRDVWHDHILFSSCKIDNRLKVTGLIDFGAMRDDSRSVDFSRLLGSLCGNDQGLWQTALGACQKIMPLTPNELRLMRVLDRSTVMLSLVNWLRWLYVERRQFESSHKILPRLRQLCQRLHSEFL